MSWRRLRVLIEHLPPESATKTGMRNQLEELSDDEREGQSAKHEPEKDRWSQQEQLLALVADRLARVEYVLILANSSGKGRKPREPQPIRRPGAQPPKQKTAPLSEPNAEKLFRLINGGAV